MMQPVENNLVMPKRYFKASNELVFLTLVVCWVITLSVDYKKAWHHPARNFVGHMNPCFGWDYPPASYIAVFSCSADVYLAWTYATLESVRTHLRNYDRRIDPHERFALVTTYLHGAAAMLWMCLWLVGPPDNQWAAHLAIFSAAVAFRYLCTLGNFLEQQHGEAGRTGRVERKHTIFVIVYGMITSLLPVVYFTNVIVYQVQGRTGVDPPIPWWVTQVLDLMWMACLALSTKFAVPEPPMLITRRVLEFDEEINTTDFTPRQIVELRKLGFTILGNDAPSMAASTRPPTAAVDAV